MKNFLCITALFGGLISSNLSKAQILAPDTVPLIIHVVHNAEAVGSGRNLAQAQIMSQFPILNADFAGQGWNVNNVPAVWASLVANTHIVFVPALVDTNGNVLAEPGIDRIDRNAMGWSNPATMNSSTLQNYLNSTIKPQSIWDNSQYCNVWLLDMNASGLLGFTTFPANSGLSWINGGTGTASTDGLCIHYKCWGDTLNVMAPYNHGRTATHEFGHWMGLPHMMAGCGAQVINDLPIGKYNQAFSSPVFPDLADTCTGYPDGPMFMNFMCNAVSDSDIYMFTSGQANAMRQGLTNGHGSVINSGVWNVTSIKTVATEDNKFTVYPNPTTGVVNIKGSSMYGQISVKVFNALSESIYDRSINDFTGVFSFSLSKQKSGVYFVVITSNAKTTVQKIILE